MCLESVWRVFWTASGGCFDVSAHQKYLNKNFFQYFKLGQVKSRQVKLGQVQFGEV